MTPLILAASMLAVGADRLPVVQSPRAKEAIVKFSDAVRGATKDFDKRVRRSRAKLIGELSSAATAARRSNNELEARKIEALIQHQEKLQERRTEPPVLAAEASAILPNTRWLLNIKQIYAFDASGKVTALSSDTGKTISEGRWKQVGPHGVKIRFGGFYVGVIETDGKSMTILGLSTTWTAKRVK